MQPYAIGGVSLGSAEEPQDSDMTHSYRLTEGRLIRYPLCCIRRRGLGGYPYATPAIYMGSIQRHLACDFESFATEINALTSSGVQANGGKSHAASGSV